MYINYRQSETEVLDADKQSVKRTVELFSTVRCRTLEHAGVLIAHGEMGRFTLFVRAL